MRIQHGLVRALMLLAILLAPSACAAPLQISGFAFDLPGQGPDDAIFIHNPSQHEVDLSIFTLSDGEGILGFPSGARIGPADSVALAGDAAGYQQATGAWPDFALHGLAADRTIRVLDPGFALSETGDDIRLLRQGVLHDRVVYGSASNEAEGWAGPALAVSGRSFLRLHARIGVTDTDTAQDWDTLSVRVLGADRHDPHLASVSQVGAYWAPESSRSRVEAFLRSANHSLRINVYQFREVGLAERITSMMHRQPELRVQVLVEPLPVGADAAETSERAHVIAELRRGGADVRFSSSTRYPYNHAKYIVADENAILVQTENFVPSGIPLDGRHGNRGFGLQLHSPELAGRLAQVFDEDFRSEAYGARQADLDPPGYARPVADPRRSASPAPYQTSAGEGIAWLIVSPHLPQHGRDPILNAIDSATQRIRVAQLNLPPLWHDPAGRPVANPYLEALRAAAQRGVVVQVLLDGHFLQDHPSRPDNQETLRLLHADGQTRPITARLARGESVLHAKMMLIDQDWTLVGSMNWNGNSVLNNREVSLLVRDLQANEAIGRIFDQDWDAADTDPHAAPTIQPHLLLATSFGIAWLLRRPRPAYKP